LLAGLFPVVLSIVLFTSTSEPDPFNGVFTAAGVICLVLGLGLIVPSAVFLRLTRPAEAVSPQFPPSASR
jgi:hypothetical protein